MGIIEDKMARELTGNVLAAVASSRAKTSSDSTRARRSSSAPFGIRGSEVAKFLISMAAAVAVAYFGMKEAIEHNTAAIEQNGARVDEARDELDYQAARLDEHKKTRAEGVKEFEKRIGVVERTTDRIELKQELTLEAIKELKTDLRDSRRRRERRPE